MATGSRNRIQLIVGIHGDGRSMIADGCKERGELVLSGCRRVGVALLACGVLILAGGEAFAQGENFSAKQPAQLFASDCTGAGCHRAPQGLGRNRSAPALAAFLREHYTNSRESAAALAAYLMGVPGAARAAPQPAQPAQTAQPEQGEQPAPRPPRRIPGEPGAPARAEQPQGAPPHAAAPYPTPRPAPRARQTQAAPPPAVTPAPEPAPPPPPQFDIFD
jgi:hypothetical protein